MLNVNHEIKMVERKEQERHGAYVWERSFSVLIKEKTRTDYLKNYVTDIGVY
jgi:hypothetical protein